MNFRVADNTRNNCECNRDLSTVTPIRGGQLLQGQGAGRKAQFGAVSLGHLHAYQTISEVQTTSIAPKNK